MRINFTSQYYLPEPGAAAHPAVVAGALARRGHDVTVLTGFPSYPDGVLYQGYRQSFRHVENVDAATVLRTPYYLSHNASGARRAASMLSFGVSASIRARALPASDVTLVYASPATTAMPAMLLRARHKVPYVLYIQDLWPDSVMASGMLAGRPSIQDAVERVLHRACLAAYQRASAIAVISPGMKEMLVERGVQADKVVCVPNWVDETVFRPTPPDPILLQTFEKHALTVMYAGGIGELQGLHHAVESMAMLGRDSGIHLAILGEGVAKPGLQALVQRRGLEDAVSFWPGRTLESMASTLGAADAQLVSLIDQPLFHRTIPSKVQASMATGQPLLVTAPGDAAAVVRQARAGVAVQPESPPALAQAMLRLRDMGVPERRAMGERGEAHYRAHMSEAAGSATLMDALCAAVR